MKKIIQSVALVLLTLGATAQGPNLNLSEKSGNGTCCDEQQNKKDTELNDDYTELPITWSNGSTQLTSAAKLVIDQELFIIAKKRKNSIIELGVHTDSKGSAVNNQSISEKRAKAIKDYLVSKGIDQNRLIAIGYGETQLKNKCKDGVTCSESEHAINRRIEFRVF